MNRAILIEVLKSYRSTFEEEINFKTQFLDLLKDNDCFLRSRLNGHMTASCWVTDQTKKNVLLLHHKKLNRWLQPGGHSDGDEDLINVASKELEEETGLMHYSCSTDIFDIDIHQIPRKKDIPAHLHYDIRFSYIADKPDEFKKNHESIDLKWVNLEDVHDLCNNEKSIMRMVNKTISSKK